MVLEEKETKDSNPSMCGVVFSNSSVKKRGLTGRKNEEVGAIDTVDQFRMSPSCMIV